MRETTNLSVEITNSKRQIMAKLGHVVHIRDAQALIKGLKAVIPQDRGSVDYSVNLEVFHLQTIFSARQQ